MLVKIKRTELKRSLPGMTVTTCERPRPMDMLQLDVEDSRDAYVVPSKIAVIAGDISKSSLGRDIADAVAHVNRFSGEGTIVTQPVAKTLLLTDLRADWYDGMVPNVEVVDWMGPVLQHKSERAMRGRIAPPYGTGVLSGDGTVCLAVDTPPENVMCAILRDSRIQLLNRNIVAWSGNFGEDRITYDEGIPSGATLRFHGTGRVWFSITDVPRPSLG